MQNQLGQNIRILRIRAGLKQEALAFKLQISRQTLSSYECGVTLPDIYILIKIADYFNISLDELSGRKKINHL